MESTVVNAKIASTFLGIDADDNMNFLLRLEFDSCYKGYGAYPLDRPKINGNRIGIPEGIIAIREILNAVGVMKWEDLAEKYVRVRMLGNEIVAIGNILEDKWVSLREIFMEGNK